MKRKNKIQIKKYILYYMISSLGGFFYYSLKECTNIWYKDGIGQYYPAFLYIGQYIRSVLSSIIHMKFVLPIFDLRIGMGEDIIGVLNYYGFGDPLNIFAVFANNMTGPYVFAFSYLLRIFLAGLAFIVYCNEMNLNSKFIPLGAVIYSFCGFALFGGGRYIEWLSVLIYFPLLVLGVERIIKHKERNCIFIIAVIYGSLCGFYYLYMSSLGLFVYWIVRIIVSNRKEFIQSAIRCLTKYILGIMISAPILFPSLMAFFNSERKGAVWYVMRDWRYYIPSPKRAVSCFLETIIPSQSDKLGVTIVGWVCIILLFVMPRSKKNLQLKIGVIICILAASITNVSWLFNALGETNDRWFYLVHFFAAVATVSVLGDVSDNPLSLGRLRLDSYRHYYLIVALVLINILINVWGLFYISNGGWINEMVDKRDSEKYIISPYNESSICMEDDSLFRVTNASLTNVNGRPENVAMINNYNGTTYWFSIVNRDIQLFADLLADKSLGHRSFGLSDNTLAEMMAGVKYKFLPDGSDYDKDSYTYVETITFNGELWNVYENKLYEGFSYCITKNAIDYSAIDINGYLEAIGNGIISDCVNYEAYENGIFHSSVETTEDCEYVVALPYSKNWDAYVDGQKVDIIKEAMFCAVSLDKGVHNIELRYSCRYITIGLILMIAGIVILISESMFEKRFIQ